MLAAAALVNGVLSFNEVQLAIAACLERFV
jgi:hypothetical protein